MAFCAWIRAPVKPRRRLQARERVHAVRVHVEDPVGALPRHNHVRQRMQPTVLVVLGKTLFDFFTLGFLLLFALFRHTVKLLGSELELTAWGKGANEMQVRRF